MRDNETARLRGEYEAQGLVEGEMPDDPFSLFQVWYSGAASAGIHDPHAFVLATADLWGRPSARAVLMKDFSADGIVFYTNLESRKSSELRANPVAAATFAWTPLRRQVRFEGPVHEVAGQVADDYFATRPRGAQVAAHASAQSRVVRSREELEARFEEITREYGEGVIPRPEYWGGWMLSPSSVEFWQGQPDRFHDRVRYVLVGESWVKERLAP